MDSIFALKYCIMYLGPISRVNISTMIFLPFFPFLPEFSHRFTLFISACSCFIEKSDEFLEKNAAWGLPSKFSTFGHLTTECTSFPYPRFLVRVRFFSGTSGAWINKMILMKKEVDKVYSLNSELRNTLIYLPPLLNPKCFSNILLGTE